MIFLFLDYISNSGVSSGFNGWQMLNTVVGSILGFAGAYALFYFNQKASEIKTDKDLKKNFELKYKYFRNVVVDMPKLLIQQSVYYKELGNKTIQEPFKSLSINHVTDTSIHRISDIKDTDIYMNSFVAFFKNGLNEGENLNVFSDLMQNIDLAVNTLDQGREIMRSYADQHKVQYSAARDTVIALQSVLDSIMESMINTVHNNLFDEYFETKKKFLSFMQGRDDTHDLHHHLFLLVRPIYKISQEHFSTTRDTTARTLLELGDKFEREFNDMKYSAHLKKEESNRISKDLSDIAGRISRIIESEAKSTTA